MRCPSCGADIGVGKKFCGKCGTALAAVAAASTEPAKTFSRVVPALVTAALVLLVAGVAWYTFGRGLSATISSGDLIYIPSFQGAGLIEIHPTQPTVRRIARTTGFNNYLVVYNRHRNEFYVGLTNGDHVAIVDGDSFTQTGKFVDGVGWNTSGLELSCSAPL
jgi:uncharacterized RmlC-like cupin family protein